MSDVPIVLQNEYTCMPWKNGLGHTLEIKRFDDQNGLRFRISQASVAEDGVFSDFTGLHRTLVLLSGHGMTLEHKNQHHSYSHQLTTPLAMARFSGGDTTYARLHNGTIEDLNIMVREADTIATVSELSAGQPLNGSHSYQTLHSYQILWRGFYANTSCSIGFDNRLIHAPAHSLLCLSEMPVKQNITLAEGRGVLIEISS